MSQQDKLPDHNDDRLKKIERIKNQIKDYPDFPKPGVVFRDIFPLFQDPSILDDLITILTCHIQEIIPKVDVIVGLESRGFLFGPILAYQLKVPFVPIRKAGKLPGKVKSVCYDLEYGSDRCEVQINSLKPGANCIVIDDLLATGGSAKSAIQLIQQCQANVLQVIVLIELTDLKGREQFSQVPCFSLVQF